MKVENVTRFLPNAMRKKLIAVEALHEAAHGCAAGAFVRETTNGVARRLDVEVVLDRQEEPKAYVVMLEWESKHRTLDKVAGPLVDKLFTDSLELAAKIFAERRAAGASARPADAPPIVKKAEAIAALDETAREEAVARAIEEDNDEDE